MKKIISIGDIHGRNVWKNFADISILLDNKNNIKPEFDYYIFIGDYTDSFELKNNDILENLIDIINFKLLYPDNVILLWGNHDIQYILEINSGRYRCTGIRPEMMFDLYHTFSRYYNLFQLSFQYKNYLFTHAGVHKGWFKFRFEKDFENLLYKLGQRKLEFDIENLSDKLNLAFDFKLNSIFDIGIQRGGSKKVGGPLWLDKITAKPNKTLNGYHQIVGHTSTKKIHTLTNKYKDTSITFIDVLHKDKSFYSIEIE